MPGSPRPHPVGLPVNASPETRRPKMAPPNQLLFSLGAPASLLTGPPCQRLPFVVEKSPPRHGTNNAALRIERLKGLRVDDPFQRRLTEPEVGRIDAEFLDKVVQLAQSDVKRKKQEVELYLERMSRNAGSVEAMLRGMTMEGGDQDNEIVTEESAPKVKTPAPKTVASRETKKSVALKRGEAKLKDKSDVIDDGIFKIIDQFPPPTSSSRAVDSKPKALARDEEPAPKASKMTSAESSASKPAPERVKTRKGAASNAAPPVMSEQQFRDEVDSALLQLMGMIDVAIHRCSAKDANEKRAVYRNMEADELKRRETRANKTAISISRDVYTLRRQVTQLAFSNNSVAFVRQKLVSLLRAILRHSSNYLSLLPFVVHAGPEHRHLLTEMENLLYQTSLCVARCRGEGSQGDETERAEMAIEFLNDLSKAIFNRATSKREEPVPWRNLNEAPSPLRMPLPPPPKTFSSAFDSARPKKTPSRPLRPKGPTHPSRAASTGLIGRNNKPSFVSARNAASDVRVKPNVASTRGNKPNPRRRPPLPPAPRTILPPAPPVNLAEEVDSSPSLDQPNEPSVQPSQHRQYSPEKYAEIGAEQSVQDATSAEMRRVFSVPRFIEIAPKNFSTAISSDESEVLESYAASYPPSVDAGPEKEEDAENGGRIEREMREKSARVVARRCPRNNHSVQFRPVKDNDKQKRGQNSEAVDEELDAKFEANFDTLKLIRKLEEMETEEDAIRQKWIGLEFGNGGDFRARQFRGAPVLARVSSNGTSQYRENVTSAIPTSAPASAEIVASSVRIETKDEKTKIEDKFILFPTVVEEVNLDNTNELAPFHRDAHPPGRRCSPDVLASSSSSSAVSIFLPDLHRRNILLAREKNIRRWRSLGFVDAAAAARVVDSVAEEVVDEALAEVAAEVEQFAIFLADALVDSELKNGRRGEGDGGGGMVGVPDDALKSSSSDKAVTVGSKVGGDSLKEMLFSQLHSHSQRTVSVGAEVSRTPEPSSVQPKMAEVEISAAQAVASTEASTAASAAASVAPSVAPSLTSAHSLSRHRLSTPSVGPIAPSVSAPVVKSKLLPSATHAAESGTASDVEAGTAVVEPMVAPFSVPYSTPSSVLSSSSTVAPTAAPAPAAKKIPADESVTSLPDLDPPRPDTPIAGPVPTSQVVSSPIDEIEDDVDEALEDDFVSESSRPASVDSTTIDESLVKSDSMNDVSEMKDTGRDEIPSD